jgi:tetratricopeptide (TPR) repeat protein
MGSRLAVLAAVELIAVALAREAAANPRARELYKRGIEEYKAQKYDAAAATLKDAYDLDPKPETLFALAQAERLAGRCPEARAHYRQLLEATTELPTARAVQTNLELCGPDPAKPAAPPPPASGAPASAPPPPPAITRTVVREVRRADKLATALLAGGMLGLGAGGGLYLASRDNRDAADRALTLGDHDRLLDRADLQQIAAIAAGGAGVALIGAAVLRWTLGGGAKTTEVTLAPSSSGTLLMVSSGW